MAWMFLKCLGKCFKLLLMFWLGVGVGVLLIWAGFNFGGLLHLQVMVVRPPDGSFLRCSHTIRRHVLRETELHALPETDCKSQIFAKTPK